MSAVTKEVQRGQRAQRNEPKGGLQGLFRELTFKPFKDDWKKMRTPPNENIDQEKLQEFLREKKEAMVRTIVRVSVLLGIPLATACAVVLASDDNAQETPPAGGGFPTAVAPETATPEPTVTAEPTPDATQAAELQEGTRFLNALMQLEKDERFKNVQPSKGYINVTETTQKYLGDTMSVLMDKEQTALNESIGKDPDQLSAEDLPDGTSVHINSGKVELQVVQQADGAIQVVVYYRLSVTNTFSNGSTMSSELLVYSHRYLRDAQGKVTMIGEPDGTPIVTVDFGEKDEQGNLKFGANGEGRKVWYTTGAHTDSGDVSPTIVQYQYRDATGKIMTMAFPTTDQAFRVGASALDGQPPTTWRDMLAQGGGGGIAEAAGFITPAQLVKDLGITDELSSINADYATIQNGSTVLIDNSTLPYRVFATWNDAKQSFEVVTQEELRSILKSLGYPVMNEEYRLVVDPNALQAIIYGADGSTIAVEAKGQNGRLAWKLVETAAETRQHQLDAIVATLGLPALPAGQTYQFFGENDTQIVVMPGEKVVAEKGEKGWAVKTEFPLPMEDEYEYEMLDLTIGGEKITVDNFSENLDARYETIMRSLMRVSSIPKEDIGKLALVPVAILPHDDKWNFTYAETAKWQYFKDHNYLAFFRGNNITFTEDGKISCANCVYVRSKAGVMGSGYTYAILPIQRNGEIGIGENNFNYLLEGSTPGMSGAMYGLLNYKAYGKTLLAYVLVSKTDSIFKEIAQSGNGSEVYDEELTVFGAIADSDDMYRVK